MKNWRLIVPGALVVAALAAPSLSAADSTGKKKPFWNRLRQPKATAPAENPATPATETNAAGAPAAAATTAAAASTPGAAQTTTPPPGANPAATPNAAGPSPAATATAAQAGAHGATPPGAPAPTSAAPAGAAPAAAVPTATAATAPSGAAPAVAVTTPVPAANTASPTGDNTAAAAAAVAVAAGDEKAERVTSGNRDIDRIVARMRTGPIGQEPSAVPYLDLLATGEATPAEMNDFASYIARKGLVQDASVIQKEATERDPKNSKLWLNLGLLERGVGRLDSAGKAFQRAVELNPANGPAWYNLGVIQDGDGQYDDAIESFRRALTIDPTLGDPKYNPQAINNNRLLVVRLMLAQQSAGTRGLSLAPMQEVAQQADTLAPETVPSPKDKTAPVEAPTPPPPAKK